MRLHLIRWRKYLHTTGSCANEVKANSFHLSIG
jgi:hypothetical protein